MKVPEAAATDWSRDGKFIVYQARTPKTKFDLWVLPLDGDRKPFPFLQTEFSEAWGQLSADGRWMVYESDESGRLEVYVQSFSADRSGATSGPGGKWQISTSGGEEPKWRRDGKELFYLAGTKLMAVDVKTGSTTFEAGVPKALFDTRLGAGFRHYAVTADGQRFLINTPIEETTVLPVTVVVHWTAGLK